MMKNFCDFHVDPPLAVNTGNAVVFKCNIGFVLVLKAAYMKIHRHRMWYFVCGRLILITVALVHALLMHELISGYIVEFKLAGNWW